MNKVELLAHRCNIIILLLIDLFEKSEITEKEFIENTQLKITFLKDNIKHINYTEIQNISKDIISYYDKVLSDNTKDSVYNTQV